MPKKEKPFCLALTSHDKNYREAQNMDKAACTVTPEGYTLWACYPSIQEARRIKKEYGYRKDKIVKVPGYEAWALFAEEN